ncbi:plastocyanin/azurin family copper-binding protein [Fictibacillus sp. S7]|uniref:plastocyanin/azurin family copper-binding protein n=1 Tax=Fictibacillus sp. S7 TaxID=2212476 RepID=UPI0013E8FCCF|nr:plastocyanin/azurin family copper-binding protein [Fictibacillus sp. S7]
MSIYILSVLSVSTAIVFISTFFCKPVKEKMSHMVFVMAYSMCFGMAIGFYLGLIFQKDLLLATVASMWVSGLVGLLIGLKIHLHSMMEGFFSGLMAGMMGAMLSAMLSVNQAHFLIMISVLLTVGFGFLCSLHFLSNSFVNFIEKYFYLFLISCCITLFVVYVTFPASFLKAEDSLAKSTSKYSSHLNDEKQKKSGPNFKDEILVNWDININNNEYQSSQQELRKNVKVTLSLTNFDSIEHDIEISPFIFEPFNERIKTIASHQHGNNIEKQEHSILHLHTEPESTNKLTFVPKVSGTYQYYCTIPGHKELGMIGIIRISN